MSEVKLNMGCGNDHLDGYVNCDFIHGPAVDIVVDLERPLHHWQDNSVDEIYCSHTLEHIVYWERTVREFWRILRPQGRLIIKVPYGLDPYTGHVRSFYPCSLDGFLVETAAFNRGLESGALFRCVERKYHRTVPYRWHLEHYIGLKLPQYGRFGKRSQITWVLEKLEWNGHGSVRA